jgi:hypothetical protein
MRRLLHDLPIHQAAATFLPLAVLATLLCGVVYLIAQQSLRSGANDPQVQVAEDAARALDTGSQPSSVVDPTTVDLDRSLALFVIVFDGAGRVLAGNGQLDGDYPVPPAGVLGHATPDAPSIVTWQPRAGVRIAAVTARWAGGTVLAGRSLREVEKREDQALLLAGVGWIVTLGALAAASLFSAASRPH